jgi:hypothetical protein
MRSPYMSMEKRSADDCNALEKAKSIENRRNGTLLFLL